MPPLRVGVIGANPDRGWAATAHLPALHLLPEIELVAVATTRPESAAEAARRWGARHAFTDAAQLVEHPDVEAVTVAVQLPHHRELVTAALDAGKHVLCEWPVEYDAAGAGRLRQRAEAAGVRHATGLQARHTPAVRLIRQLIDQRRIGELLSATLTYSAPGPGGGRLPQRYAWIADRASGVNALTISGGHALDVLRFCCGEFTELSATLATRQPHRVIAETGEPVTATAPDHALVTGRLTGGAVASVAILTGMPRGTGFRLECAGTDGVLVLTGDVSLAASDLTVTLVGPDGTPQAVPTPASDQLATALPALAGQPSVVRNAAALYAAFATAIRTDIPFEPDFGTATALHTVLDTICAAADSGHRTTLLSP